MGIAETAIGDSFGVHALCTGTTTIQGTDKNL
jgi:hypothetical protein